MDQISVFIVDDETACCENLSEALTGYEDINIVGAACSTIDAGLQIARLKPQVVFLDIEMREENAFRFLDRVAPVSFDIVFVTAYDEYAIWAFRVNAIDYILKPIDPDEVTRCIERIRKKYADARHTVISAQPPFSPLDLQIRNREKPQQILLRNSDRHEVVLFQDIVYVEALGRYSKIFFQQNGALKSLLMSRNISEYETLFPSDLFFRSHRSFLVNCEFILHLKKDGEAGVAVLKNKKMLPVSRRRFPVLLQFLKSNVFHTR